MRTFIAILAIAFVASVQAKGTWKVLNGSLATDIVGIGFTSAQVGYMSGDGNGVGPMILKTTNGGVDWNMCPASFGPDILLLDCDAADETIVVSSVFGELYSDDGGNSFTQSVGGGQSQSVRFLGKDGSGGKKFGVAGTFQFGKKQGCAISTDGGKKFTPYDAGLFTFARYGAYPTDTTWYISAGQWPSSNPQAEPKRRNEFMNAKGKVPRHFTPTLKVGDGDGYMAQIVKTTDGGKTFKTVFAENGTFYFNAIDCSPNNENFCCATGEATGTSQSGARIHCTYDGGQTWNRTFWSPETSGHGYSIMEIRWVTETDIWAVGGELASIAPSAWFLQSTDGGKTWEHNVKPIFGYYGFGLSMVDADHGFAAVDDLITQMSGVAKYEP